MIVLYLGKLIFEDGFYIRDSATQANKSYNPKLSEINDMRNNQGKIKQKIDKAPTTTMPPVLDPRESLVDGLAFIGLSLARKSEQGHMGSQTHQTAFDLNEVIDRDYKYIFSTNDDGWLVGGGEPGPPKSYKLASSDSAHVEIMRVGTYNEDWGGLSVESIVEAIKSAKILIPEVTVVPTAVVANQDLPPELEIRFDMKPAFHADEGSELPPLPVNWQLRFVHNQLFRLFKFPSRFCPGAFHSTIVRKAEFRSLQHRADFFEMCEGAVQRWRNLGPKPLVPPVTKNIERIQCPKITVHGGELGSSTQYRSGIWLFTDRKNPTHLFEPNFLPPYDTEEKRKIIIDVLSQEWDEKTLSWKVADPLPKPQIPIIIEKDMDICGFGALQNGNFCGSVE